MRHDHPRQPGQASVIVKRGPLETEGFTRALIDLPIKVYVRTAVILKRITSRSVRRSLSGVQPSGSAVAVR